jgi:hypothetical protein
MKGSPSPETPNRNSTGVYSDEIVVEIAVAGGSRAVVVERATKSAVEKFTERFPGVSVTIDGTGGRARTD